MIEEIKREENGKLTYYRDGSPTHAGLVLVNNKIYYAAKHGEIVTGLKYVHKEMLNGVLSRKGYYYFNKNGVKVPLIWFPKIKKHHSKNKRRKAFAIYIVIPALILASVGGIIYYKIANQRRNESFSSSSERYSSVSLSYQVAESYSLMNRDLAPYFSGLATAEQIDTLTPSQDVYITYDVIKPSSLRSTQVGLYLKIGLDNEFKDCRFYTLPLTNRGVTIPHLFTGKTYYYQFILTVDGQDDTYYEGSFVTDPGTRFLSIDGLHNVRDIGTYENLDGKKIKQGMIIRGTETDALTNFQCYLNSTSWARYCDNFNFAYEMDLRSSSLWTSGPYTSRLGTTVGHDFYSFPSFNEMFSESSYPSIRAAFEKLADESSYPMYLDCENGHTRTGGFVYLLDAVLGLSNATKSMEFELSRFSSKSLILANLNPILSRFNVDTSSDVEVNSSICNFLTETVGVSSTTLDSIRNILLED